MTTSTLDAFAAAKLATLDTGDLRRALINTDRGRDARTRRGSRTLVSFACNDYLGLSQHPDVIAASCAASREFGAGAGASRHVTGNHSLYRELEQTLAAFKGTEDAVVFGSGYLANIGVIPALANAEDLILLDEYCHSCLFAGAALARSHVLTFAHNDAAQVDTLLGEHRARYRHCLVLTEGVFSMDGDRAPLAALLRSTERHDAWLMLDDAHGFGVLENGRGSAVVDGVALPIPLQMGTLSKAVGAYGGYLCASQPVAEFIRNRARSLIYTTGLPPGTVAAATTAIEIIVSDRALVAKPLEHARAFASACGMPEPPSPIVPIVLGTPERALRASRALEDYGFLVVAIRPPTVPDGTARLRCTFSAAHTSDDVRDLAMAVNSVLHAR